MSVVSMKITDSPGPIEVIPFRVTAVFAGRPPTLRELSSIFQPVIFTAVADVFVTSNQSAPNAVPLDHGATSEMMIPPAANAGVTGVGKKVAISDKRTIALAIDGH
jgi:hypothetical protein